MSGALNEDAGELHARAKGEARRLSHTFVGCEHFLLGSIVYEAGVAARVLSDHGVTLEAATREIHKHHVPMPPAAPDRGVQSTPAVGNVLAIAAVEAERLGEPTAGSAHVFLALLTEGGSVAVWALRGLDVDLPGLARDTLIALRVPAETRERYLAERAAATLGRRPPGAAR